LQIITASWRTIEKTTENNPLPPAQTVGDGVHAPVYFWRTSTIRGIWLPDSS
jgi:hypothetical protein